MINHLVEYEYAPQIARIITKVTHRLAIWCEKKWLKNKRLT
jgi:hypothetical protein